jgi:hypothetical protein
MKYTRLNQCSELDTSDRSLEILEERVYQSSSYFPLYLIGLYKKEEELVVCINKKQESESYWEESSLPPELYKEFLDMSNKHLIAS